MLLDLQLEQYAVVERVHVAFHPGLNLLTGETGSGKSIVVGALSLLFGARASADVVRRGARRARICGTFDVPPGASFLERLDRAGIDPDPEELVIERHVLATGRSRAYVNGSPATLALLGDLAGRLGDIHGQHEQQNLRSAAQQLAMLDAYAGLGEAVARVGESYRRWQSCSQQLDQLKSEEQDRLRSADLLRHQAGELEAAAIEPEEDTDLKQERDRLANAERLRIHAHEAYDALYDSARSAAARLKSATDALTAMAEADPALAGHVDSLEDARSAVEDAAYDLRGYLGSLRADPARLEEVEDRLAHLERLKRKYGPRLEDVLAFQVRVQEQLAGLESAGETIARVEAQLGAASAEYRSLSESVSRRRRKAAEQLARRTGYQLAALALRNSTFLVRLDELGSWGPKGRDKVSLHFSANPGQPPRPLAQAASGGELSRVALALKTTLQQNAAHGEYRRALVFDEVDSGVGGQVAEAIGRRLQGLAEGGQVLCVTHLPQVACFADAHYRVVKTASAVSTTATVLELGGTERVDELARMLSGAEVTPAALENARELLRGRQRVAGTAGAALQRELYGDQR